MDPAAFAGFPPRRLPAVRRTLHAPPLLVEPAARIDRIAGGRLALNEVSSGWAAEARKYGVQFDRHRDRYPAPPSGWTGVDGRWQEPAFSHEGRYRAAEQAILEPEPARRPIPCCTPVAGSPAARDLVSRKCDARSPTATRRSPWVPGWRTCACAASGTDCRHDLLLLR